MALRGVFLTLMVCGHAHWLPVFFGRQPKIDRNDSHPSVEAQVGPGGNLEEPESPESEAPPKTSSTSYFTSEWGRWSLFCLFQWERGLFSTPELRRGLGEDGGWVLYLAQQDGSDADRTLLAFSGVIFHWHGWPRMLPRSRVVLSCHEKHTVLLLLRSSGGHRPSRPTCR